MLLKDFEHGYVKFTIFWFLINLYTYIHTIKSCGGYMHVKILFLESSTISRSNQTLGPKIVHAVEANTIKTSEKNCRYKIDLMYLG